MGGGTYQAWGAINAGAIAALVSDLGLDGVDIDFEVTDDQPQCALWSGLMRCATDAKLTGAVRALRAALPPPKVLVAALWSVGAYGERERGEPQGRPADSGIPLVRQEA